MRYLIIALVLLAVTSAFALDGFPIPYDLTVQGGESFALAITPAESNGRAVDLTGYSYQAQARTDYSSAPFFNFSTIVTTNKVTLSLSQASTAAATNKHGVWDLLQIDPSGQRTYLLRGKIMVVPVVTR